MYTSVNFKTKRALKDAVKTYMEGKGLPITYFQPGPFGGQEPMNGTIYLEGPHFPKPHTWYAQAEVRDGVIIKVK
jgi:hypothetical protein